MRVGMVRLCESVPLHSLRSFSFLRVLTSIWVTPTTTPSFAVCDPYGDPYFFTLVTPMVTPTFEFPEPYHDP